MSTHINVVKAGGKFFEKEFHLLRLDFVVDLLLPIGVTVAVFSGMPISKDILSPAGIQLNNDQE